MPGIPALERRPQVLVQDPGADLQQPVRPPLGPPHLLLLDHPLADHLIDRRFRERRRDRLAMAIPIPVVGDRGPVGLDVMVELAHGLEQLLRPLGSLLPRLEVALQVLDDLQGPVDVAVPEVPLQALQRLLQVRPRPAGSSSSSSSSPGSAGGGPLQGQPLGHLAHHGQPHRDVEPVQPVLGFRAQVQRQLAHGVAAVGQEQMIPSIMPPAGRCGADRRGSWAAAGASPSRIGSIRSQRGSGTSQMVSSGLRSRFVRPKAASPEVVLTPQDTHPDDFRF